MLLHSTTFRLFISVGHALLLISKSVWVFSVPYNICHFQQTSAVPIFQVLERKPIDMRSWKSLKSFSFNLATYHVVGLTEMSCFVIQTYSKKICKPPISLCGFHYQECQMLRLSVRSLRLSIATWWQIVSAAKNKCDFGPKIGTSFCIYIEQ